MHKKSWVIKESTHKTILTEVAGEGGPDLEPQKFLLSQSLGTLWDEEICQQNFFYLA